MPEPLSVQGILKRLLEAEKQAQEILEAAARRAQEMISQAHEQSAKSFQAVREEAAQLSRTTLAEARSKAAAKVQQRLDTVEAEAREMERRARENFPEAVDMVIGWVTRGGK